MEQYCKIFLSFQLSKFAQAIKEQHSFPLHRLSDPLTAEMGRFCLTAQATLLLGKILRIVKGPSGRDEFRGQEANFLDTTIAVLTKISLQEGQTRDIGVCSPTTICYRYVKVAGRIDRLGIFGNRITVSKFTKP
jgi:hypothetical protein